MGVEVVEQRGWPIVRLSSDLLEVDVLPGKGGDILAVRWRQLDLNVLWTSPWGLRERGSVPDAADSGTAFLQAYAGGWQTLFPNGGTAVVEQGVELGFHGEATMIPWQWEQTGPSSVVLTTELMRSPFSLRREITVLAGAVEVTETFRNLARTDQPTMWSHHPAFGAPFLDATCRLETGATAVLPDADYDTAHNDLASGQRSAWPMAVGKDGSEVDLRLAPAPDAVLDRMAYLLDFAEPSYTLTNPSLGLQVAVSWDGEQLPSAWLWTEAAGTQGAPWHQRAYVLAVEPASSYPGSGLGVAKENGTALWFTPGQERTVTVRMELSPT